MKKIKVVLPAVAGCALVVAMGFTVLAYQTASAVTAPPATASFPPDLVALGEKVAAAGYCVTCHTAPGGQPFAGGLPMATGFGTIYSTNITPDAETGLGKWTLKDFTRAMHEGVSRDGSHLFPAFPYDRFTKTSDDDIKALYAFMMTRPAVSAPAKPVEMPFPLNVRSLQAVWKLLYFKEGRYEPNPAQNAEWNRGAYLAEGLAHCASCHSPRNALGAEKGGLAKYSGALIDGWFAPALTVGNRAPVPWTSDMLYEYLRKGGTPYHGVAAGPMSHVVYQGMALIDDSDVRAIATYFASFNGSTDKKIDVPKLVDDTLAKSRFDATHTLERGAALYASACASCHYNASTTTGTTTPLATRPELGFKSSLYASDPTNLVQVILHGVSLKEGLPDAMMPAFGRALSDDDIAALVLYLRKSRTDLPPWSSVAERVAQIRASEPAKH